jgi:hypothetical protein
VTHDGSILTFTPSSGFVGEAQLSYTISDGNGGLSTASVSVLISGVIAQAPVITAPINVEVNATGYYTKVDLGVATAINSQGQSLPISLVGGQPQFRPGNHLAYWQTTDAVSGLTSIASQGVVVHPLVSLSKSQPVIEGNTAVVKVLLNGEAPSYPVIVSINVSGTANSSDFDGIPNQVQITSGTQASIEINILQDELAEGNETLILSLDSNNNGMKVIHTLTITEQNVAPKIALSSAQNGQTRQVITAEGGLVSITATLNDINDDVVNTDWQYDASLAMNENSDTAITLDPSELSPGMYSITLTATDEGEGQLSDTQTLYLEVLAELIILTDIDSDGDMIPDSEEGYSDSDNDGIPDFLDAIAECNVMPQQVAVQSGFLIQGESGACLRKGNTLSGGETGGVQLTDVDLDVSIGRDSEALNVGGIFDFIINGLSEKGEQSQIVLPQRQPIPAGAVYRKYSDAAAGWLVFVEDANNQLHSTAGEKGFCPLPGSAQWTPGITAGHWCVQLTLNDGGPNDNDGIANGTIVDPGGVAVLITNNSLPEANTDIARVKRNGSVTIDVLANDTDGDGDMLSLGGVNATFGSVTITADQHLAYQSKADFVGVDSITYTLSDGNGGSASSTVSVTVYVNDAPLAVNDSANTDDRSAIVLDVVSNDSDADGDLLSLISASVDFGVVVINDDNTLTYKPSEGFSGTATVSYTIDDGQGEQATAEVAVLVEAYETVTVKNKAKGGSMGLMLLGLAGLVWLRLHRYRQLASGGLANAIALILCMSLVACSSPDDDEPVVVAVEDVAPSSEMTTTTQAAVDTASLTPLPKDDKAQTTTSSPLLAKNVPLNTYEVVSPTLTPPKVNEDDRTVLEVVEPVTESVAAKVAKPVTDSEAASVTEPVLVDTRLATIASNEVLLIEASDEPATDTTEITDIIDITDSRSEDKIFVDAESVPEETVAATAIGFTETDDIIDTHSSNTPVISHSSSDVSADIHWFITGSVGQSKVVEPLLLPANSAVEDISIDRKGTSYIIGGGISYKDLSVTLSYTNLGKAGAEITGDTLNRASFEQSLLATVPNLVDGLSVETQYAFWSNERLTAAVGLGLLAWKLDYSSQLQGSVIRANEQGVDVFYQANLSYQLSDEMCVSLKAARYQLSLNEVNNLSLGLRYSF